MRAVYETNVFGAVRVLHAFLPLLEKSAAPVVVNVSSGLGSLGLAADPGGPWSGFVFPVYSSSKAALNMLTVQYAAALPGMRINSVDPGFTATDFNAHRGTQTVEEGAAAIVRHALIGPDGPTGGFYGASGARPWRQADVRGVSCRVRRPAGRGVARGLLEGRCVRVRRAAARPLGSRGRLRAPRRTTVGCLRAWRHRSRR
jgi:NAD(P)-dependent dehydrogenase (short-subunit alcohol dehydrogenase family)